MIAETHEDLASTMSQLKYVAGLVAIVLVCMALALLSPTIDQALGLGSSWWYWLLCCAALLIFVTWREWRR